MPGVIALAVTLGCKRHKAIPSTQHPADTINICEKEGRDIPLNLGNNSKSSSDFVPILGIRSRCSGKACHCLRSCSQQEAKQPLMEVWSDCKAQILTPLLSSILGVCPRLSFHSQETEAQRLVQTPRGWQQSWVGTSLLIQGHLLKDHGWPGR